MANEARFTGLADAYGRGRPDYPDAAFEAMTLGLARPLRAVDVGCGTGISTRRLARFTESVIGVDPNPEMLAAARRTEIAATRGESAAPPDAAPRLPAPIDWVHAPAEATTLPSQSFELLLAAQAFHWFDAPRALSEFARLLVPGGRIALLWNLRDDRHATTRAYSAITVPEAKKNLDATSIAARSDTGLPLASSPHFRAYRRVDLANEQRLDLAGLLDRARSASYYPKSGSDREAADAKLHALFDEAATAGVIVIRYRVELHLAERS